MTPRASSLRVLGIDTATRAGGVALLETCDGGATTRLLAEAPHDEDHRHAETLLPAIDTCLERAGVPLDRVDGYAVSIGPGSFTGLRVGLATAKGLAFATGGWLVGVPTLEAYACAEARRVAVPPAGDRIVVCLDARKGEVYSALFAVEERAGRAIVVRVLEDAVESPKRAVHRLLEALEAAVGVPTTLRVVGDGAGRHDEILVALQARAPVAATASTPAGSGAAVAEVGLEQFLRDGPADLARLAPAYVRASEAEIGRRRREGAVADSH